MVSSDLGTEGSSDCRDLVLTGFTTRSQLMLYGRSRFSSRYGSGARAHGRGTDDDSTLSNMYNTRQRGVPMYTGRKQDYRSWSHQAVSYLHNKELGEMLEREPVDIDTVARDDEKALATAQAEHEANAQLFNTIMLMIDNSPGSSGQSLIETIQSEFGDDEDGAAEAITRDGHRLWAYLKSRAQVRGEAECERIKEQIKKVRIHSNDTGEWVERKGNAIRRLYMQLPPSERTKKTELARLFLRAMPAEWFAFVTVIEAQAAQDCRVVGTHCVRLDGV